MIQIWREVLSCPLKPITLKVSSNHHHPLFNEINCYTKWLIVHMMTSQALDQLTVDYLKNTEQASVSVRCNNNAIFGFTSSLNMTRPITMTDCGNNQSIFIFTVSAGETQCRRLYFWTGVVVWVTEVTLKTLITNQHRVCCRIFFIQTGLYSFLCEGEEGLTPGLLSGVWEIEKK